MDISFKTILHDGLPPTERTARHDGTGTDRNIGRDIDVTQPPRYSVSRVLFLAIQGLNLVDLCLKEAEERNDTKTIHWLRETKEHYQHILKTAEEI